MKKVNPRRIIDIGDKKMIVDFSDFLKVWKDIEKNYKNNLGKKTNKKPGGK
jgi:hypothetical protein